jgi:hypothetical protein
MRILPITCRGRRSRSRNCGIDEGRDGRQNRLMPPWSRREPERLPDLAAAGRDALHDIDGRSQQDTEALLSVLMWAAWPTPDGQSQ